MKIRFTAPEDIPELIEFGRRCHAMTRFRIYNYDAARLEATLRGIIDSKTGRNCFFVAEGHGPAIIGVLIGSLDRHFFSDHLVASIVHYDVLPERRMSGAAVRLLTAFRKWAENRGAFELTAGVNSGTEVERTGKFLTRLGFEPTGGNYSLLLSRADLTPVREADGLKIATMPTSAACGSLT